MSSRKCILNRYNVVEYTPGPNSDTLVIEYLGMIQSGGRADIISASLALPPFNRYKDAPMVGTIETSAVLTEQDREDIITACNNAFTVPLSHKNNVKLQFPKGFVGMELSPPFEIPLSETSD